MNKPYVVVASTRKGLDAIKLTEEPWEGIIYSYGKISFNANEETDTLHLAFDYEVHDYNNKTLTDAKPFESYIGKILEELLHEGVQENSLTYTGGIDENRTEDSE